MDVSKLRDLRLASPFRQFFLILQDGRRLLVDRPYHIGIAPDGSHLMVMPGGRDAEQLLPDQVRDVDVTLTVKG